METKRKPGRPRKLPKPEEVKVTPVALEPKAEATVVGDPNQGMIQMVRGTVCPLLSVLKSGWTDCIQASCAMWGRDRCGLVHLP